MAAQLADARGSTACAATCPAICSRALNVIGRIRDDYVSGLDWNLLHFTTVRGFAGTLFADAAAITTCDAYGLSTDRVYYDVGYSFRVLHDAFGVYQQLHSRSTSPCPYTAPRERLLPQGAARIARRPRCCALPFLLLVTFLPNF